MKKDLILQVSLYPCILIITSFYLFFHCLSGGGLYIGIWSEQHVKLYRKKLNFPPAPLKNNLFFYTSGQNIKEMIKDYFIKMKVKGVVLTLILEDNTLGLTLGVGGSKYVKSQEYYNNRSILFPRTTG